MLLSLTRDTEGKSGFVHVRTRDLLYLECDTAAGGVSFHTRDEQFFGMGTMKYYQTALASHGLHFTKADRNIFLNMEKVVWIDRKDGFVYFEREIRQDSKRCMVAISKTRQFINEVLQINPAVIVH